MPTTIFREWVYQKTQLLPCGGFVVSLEERCLSTHQASSLRELMGCKEETESRRLVHLQNLRFHLCLPLGCW